MKILWFLLTSGIYLTEGWSDNKQRSFSPNFMFGVGSSAYQVEGAHNIDGKGESIWDRYSHEHPEFIVDGTNGDVASDSYHNFQRDVEMLRELGVDHYRFSIAWSRVLPTGFLNNKNEKGFEYYDNLIDELLKYNIEPVITIYHMDLPQRLQDLGGWANPLSVEWFEDYAGALFERYSSRVKYWVTINQPNNICLDGYGDVVMAPAIGMRGVADYLCIKNVMVAHAKAYRLYEKLYKNKYKGQVGIALALNWADPINNKTENAKAAEDFREFTLGLYMNPIWSIEGDFPKVVRERVAKKSAEQGYPRSRLPSLTAEEKKLLKGSADFVGMNHYTTLLVKPATVQYDAPSFLDDVGVELSQGRDWKPAKSVWLKSAPYGIYKVCLYINKQYDYPPVFVTEHGWSTDAGLGDQSRVDNLRGYLGALLYAIEDGTQIIGYTYWSLLDNAEWTAGVSERFGLYEVDFNSKQKTRTPRLSAHAYKRIIDARVVEDNWEPSSLHMAVSDRRTKKNKVEL